MKKFLIALAAVFVGSLAICSCEKDPVIGDGSVSFKYNTLNVEIGQNLGNPYVINDSKITDLIFMNYNDKVCLIVVDEESKTVIVKGNTAGKSTVYCYENSKEGTRPCLGGFTVYVK